MIAGKCALIVVPARGGSRGIPNKNLRPLDGRPLIAYTASLVRQLDWVDRAVVSTDSDQIAAVAAEYGLDVPFRRQVDLAGDEIGDWPVLDHALRETERLDGRRYDLVVMLQPTCPLRRPEHVTAVVEKLVTEDWDAVWTVSAIDLAYHPLKALTLGAGGRLEYFDARGAAIVARQQLAPVYHRNGAAYAVTRSCLAEQRTIKGSRTAAIVVSDRLVNIDQIDDFDEAERVLRS